MSTARVWFSNQYLRLRARSEDGQGLAEYAFILSLVAVVVAAALLPLEDAISGRLQETAALF